MHRITKSLFKKILSSKCVIGAQFLHLEFQVPVEPGQGDPDRRVREDDELLPGAPPPLGHPHQVQVQGGGLRFKERPFVSRIRVFHGE